MLSATFLRFIHSEKLGGVLLFIATLTALFVANSTMGDAFIAFWHTPVAGLSLQHWINDALMAIFFLLIGLELERELYVGELSTLKKALLPGIAALGGVIVPAAIHFTLNAGSETQRGAGIPMATDIAFALGMLAILGSRVPSGLKVFLTALAVMDDLIAVVVIAIFYTADVAALFLFASLLVWGMLLMLNRVWRVMQLWPYVIGGVVMWGLMLKSGVHGTVAGVLLAFAIPFSSRTEDKASPSHRLEHALHFPVAFLILPLFALANTGIKIEAGWTSLILNANGLGIFLGLVIGKPLGIVILAWLAIRSKLCQLPDAVTWSHLLGAGMLAGIGFTMSIFITNLAFAESPEWITSSKLAILAASLISSLVGLAWLATISRLRHDVGHETSHHKS